MHEIGDTPLRHSGYAPQTPAPALHGSSGLGGSTAPSLPLGAAQYLESPIAAPRAASRFPYGAQTEPRLPTAAQPYEVTRSYESSLPAAYARGGGDSMPRPIAEAADREGCEFNVVKVCRVVAFFCRQLQAITEGRIAHEPTLQHVRDLCAALLAEVKSTAACVSPEAGALADIPGISEALTPQRMPVAPPLPPLHSAVPSTPLVGGSPTMRAEELNSLNLQHRIDSLRSELQREIHTNQDLVSSLNSAKDINSKLEEQVRQQTEEISTLTVQIQQESGRLEDMERARRLENDLREKDVQRRMASLQEAADARCHLVRKALSEQLRATLARLDQVRKDCSRLKIDQADQKRAVHASCEAMQQFFQDAEEDILQRLQGFIKKQRVLEASSVGTANDLEARIAAEQELRLSEVSSWSHRHALLSAERDDLQARMACDISNLSAQLQATQQSLEHAERVHDGDRAAWIEQRTSLEVTLQRQRDESAHNFAVCEAACEQLRREAAESMRALADIRSVLEEERITARQDSTELSRQLRAEAEQALAAAAVAAEVATQQAAKEAAGREEALKDQLDEQRRCLTDAGDRAMASCLEACEQRLLRTTEEGQENLARAAVCHRSTEEHLQSLELELQRSQSQVAAATDGEVLLHEELSFSKAELLERGKTLQSSQDELAHVRRELVEERAHLQGLVDELQGKRSALEAECRATQERLLEFTRVSADTDLRQSQATAVLEAGLRQRDTHLEEAERRLAGARDEATTATAEAKYHQMRASEVQVALDQALREVVSERSCLEAERQRVQAAVMVEASMARENREQHDRWQESHVESLQQARTLVQAFSDLQAQTQALEDCSLEVAALDSRQIYQDELSTATQKLTEMRGKLEVVEYEGLSTKQQLNDSQTNLVQTRRECQREEQAAAAAESALKNATSNEATLTRQLEQAAAQHQQETQKLKQEIVTLQHACDLQVAEMGQQMRTVEAEFEARILAAEAQHRSNTDREVQRERVRAESVLQDNLQLRHKFAEQRRGANAGMNALQLQLETHIAQLQHQTESFSPSRLSPRASATHSAAVVAQAHLTPQASTPVGGSALGSSLRGLAGGLTAQIGTIGST